MQPSIIARVCLAGISLLVLLLNPGAQADDVSEDTRLAPADRMRKYGYKVEIYKVTTEDGYILEVDRIPAAQNDVAETRHTPVLLVPGLLADAGCWVTNLPSQSPGYLLADAGFDVWFLNTRGVPQSNFHKTLTTQDKEFWEWSFEELGMYDLAAVIDFVLNMTGSSKVGLLTLSQGFTTSLVLLSMRPEYNEKVNILVGYGPVANFTYTTSIVRLAVPSGGVFKAAVDIFSKGSFLVSSQLQRNIIANVCNGPLRYICYLPVAIVAGVNPKQLNTTRIPVYVATIPVGTSTKDFVHMTQVIKEKNLVRYDYGAIKNIARYGQRNPPAYPLEKITVPVALFSGMGDILADPKDVEDLSHRMRHVLVMNYTVPDPDFTHQDFIYGYNATDILHRPMMKVLKNYTAISVQ